MAAAAVAGAWAGAREWSPEPSLADRYDVLAPTVVGVHLNGPDAKVGSGFAVSETKVVTARHLVLGVEEVTVQGVDGAPRLAHVVGTDARTDLALIEVEGGGLTPVHLGESTHLRVGDSVLAIGSPFGLGHSLAVGIVGSLNRRIVGPEGASIGPESGFLQLTIPLNPGNSGGPVFDDAGDVVAILSGTHAQGQAIAFAVPVEALRDALPQLEAGEQLSRAFLGVRTELSEGRLLVSAVTPGGPADKAGLRPDDQITAIDGASIGSPEALHAILDHTTAGTTAQMSVTRGTTAMLVPVELSDWAVHPIVVSGMTLRPLAGTGGEVVAVRPRSRAEKAGVHIGDVVRTVGGLPVQAPVDVQQAIAMGRDPIEVLREGSPVIVTLGDSGG